MSELKSIPKELREALRFPLITNSEEFQNIWRAQRYAIGLHVRRLLTPEIKELCDKDVKDKILRDGNEYLGIILHKSLQEIVSYMRARDDKFYVHVYLSKDPYLPYWDGITIFIKMVYRNFSEKIRVWRELEDKITKVINKFKRLNPNDLEKIDEANETIATTIERF